MFCERCNGVEAMRGYRFCGECKKALLREMWDAGYLETGGFGRKGQNRTAEAKEDVHETKRGRDR
jgi:hypothetical protein